MSIRFREECHGYSGGQTNCILHAIEDNKTIGYIDFAYHKVNGRKQAYINMIRVFPSHQGKNIGKELIRQLANNVPYDAIDWGLTTDEGHLLKTSMDKEFGTTFKPGDEDVEPDIDDPKYANEPDNDRYFANRDVWRARNGYVDECNSIYFERNRVMKFDELRKLVKESVNSAIEEAGYDQYGEGLSDASGSFEDKMEEATHIAIDAAARFTRMSQGERKAGDGPLVLDRAISQIVNLFLDENGDLSDPDAIPDEMEDALFHMIGGYIHQHEEQDREAIYGMAHKIVVKAIGRLNQNMMGVTNLDESPPPTTMFEHVNRLNFFTVLK